MRVLTQSLSSFCVLTFTLLLSCGQTGSSTAPASAAKFKMPSYGPIEQIWEKGGWWINRLRGYVVKIYPGWSAAVLPEGFVVQDPSEQYLVRVVPMMLPAEKAAEFWDQWQKQLQSYLDEGAVTYVREEANVVHVYVSSMASPSARFRGVRSAHRVQLQAVFIKGKTGNVFCSWSIPNSMLQTGSLN